MSGKTVTVLTILVAALAGFFYYDTYWLEPAREKRESVKGRLWEVEPKDVESLTIKRKGETVRLRRTDSGWELLEPVKTRADRGAVDGIVTTVVTARVDREVSAAPGTLDEFGLAPPETEARDLGKPVTELRDRTVLAFERKSVGQVDIQLPGPLGGESITLESVEAGKW